MAINLIEEYKKRLSGLSDGLSSTLSSPLGRFATSAGKEAVGFVGDVGQGIVSAITSPAIKLSGAAQAQQKANDALLLQQQAKEAQQQKRFQDARKLMDEAMMAGNQRAGLERSLMTDYREKALRSATGGVKSLLTASGLKAGLLTIATTAGFGGLLSGGLATLTGEDPYTAAGQGVGSGARTAGLSRLTNPVIDKVLGKTGNLLVKAPVAGGLNVLEDTAYTLGTEGRLPTAGENITSFGIGTAGPIAGSTLNLSSKTFNSLKNKLTSLFQEQNPKAPIQQLERQAQDQLEKMWKKVVDKNGTERYIRDQRFGKRVQNARDIVGKNKQAAYGLAAGVEVYQDDNGEWQVKYNPEKAIVGVGLAAGVTSLKNGKLGDAVGIGKTSQSQMQLPSKLQTPQTKAQTPIDLRKEMDIRLTGNLPKTDTSVSPSQGIIPQDVQKYISDQVTKQEQAAQGAQIGLGGKVKSTLAHIKTKFVDATAPIQDIITEAEKKYQFTVRPTQDPRLQIDRVLRSETLAGQFIKDNGLDAVIKEVPDLNALDQYLIAKQSLRVQELGKETGRDAAKDKQLVDTLAPQYEQFAQRVTAYSRKILDYAVETGLVSKEVAEQLKVKYPDYVPLQRIFSEDELGNISVNLTGAGPVNLSKQTIVQKLQGSKREIASPIESLLIKTSDLFRQGERNIAARQFTQLSKLPDNPLGIIPLRTAENVNKRIDIFQDIGQLGVNKRKLESLLQTRGKWAGKLQRQLNRLNQMGLDAYLKQSPEPQINQQTSGIQLKQSFVRPAITTDTGDSFLGPAMSTKNQITDLYVVPTEKEVKQLVNDLVNSPPDVIASIKKKIATRENKLGAILDEIETLRIDVDELKTKRNELFSEAKLLQDAKTKGKSTLSYINNGIKEIYEVSPEIEAAAKALNKEQIGFVIKMLSIPTRILQAGATGLNIPFVVTNLWKDQINTILNSKSLNQTFLNPINFTKALFAAVGKNGLYDEVVRNAAGGTSYDIAREAPKLTVNRIRSGKNIGSKIKYTVTHPTELLRAIEDTIGTTEQLTRIQNYRGYKEALLAQGRTQKDAELLAAKAARETTANFARKGEYGRVLNYLIPFFNAGVQGARTTVNAFRDRPVQTGIKYGLTIFTPIAAVTAWNLNDPERKKAYDDIPEWEKNNNIVLIPPNPIYDEDKRQWNVIKIPLPPGASNLGSIVRKTLDETYKVDPQSIADIFANMITASTGQDVTDPSRFIGGLVPQAVKPIVETTMNRNMYTGRDIVPSYMKDMLPEEQVYKSTSGTARIIGKPLNISPRLVENAVSTMGGGVGKQLLNASDRVLNKAGVIPQEQIGGEDPFTNLGRRFLKASGGETETKIKEGEAKARVEAKRNGTAETADVYYVKKNDGKVYRIDKTPPVVPQLTGNREVDNELLKQYSSDISSRVGDVYDLYKAGKMTEAQAKQEMQQLEIERYKASLKSGTKSPTKPRSFLDISNDKQLSELTSEQNRAFKDYQEGKIKVTELDTKIKTIKVKKLKYTKPKKISVKGYKVKKIKIKQAKKPKKIKVIKVKKTGRLS